MRGKSLAERMRPQTLHEFVGQQHLLGPGRPLAEAIQRGKLPSFILWGPPGSGKTTLARIVGGVTALRFVAFSAATAGAGAIRRLTREARRHDAPVLLFVDELHRLTEADQDALLPLVEEEAVILMGATTHLPDTALGAALLSRAAEYPLRPLTEDEMRVVLRRALEDPQRGLGGETLRLEPAAEDFLIFQAGGDARALLNALERLALTGAESETVGAERAAAVTAPRATEYEGGGDNHHDVVAAFVQSMRGSDPDATLYWLARMLVAGEDPAFVATRILLAAAEDVGTADPLALVVAQAAVQAAPLVNAAAARGILAEAALYVATAPKSAASHRGLERALADVRRQPRHPVPLHLRTRTLCGAPEPGYGQGGSARAPLTGGFLFRQYLPESLVRNLFYEPGDEGLEARLRERLRAWWPEKR